MSLVGDEEEALLGFSRAVNDSYHSYLVRSARPNGAVSRSRPPMPQKRPKHRVTSTYIGGRVRRVYTLGYQPCDNVHKGG